MPQRNVVPLGRTTSTGALMFVFSVASLEILHENVPKGTVALIQLLGVDRDFSRDPMMVVGIQIVALWQRYRELHLMLPLSKSPLTVGYLGREISAEMKAEIQKENILVGQFGDISRTAVRLPYRPSYGTKGKQLELRTNYFPIGLPRELILHRYTIKVDARHDENGNELPAPKNKKLKQIIRILLNHLESRSLKSPIATDFKSNLICSGKIPQDAWNPRIKYFHEGDNAPGKDPQEYQLHIEELLPNLHISGLQDFLNSAGVAARYESKESMLQALNIVLGHHAKSTPTTTMVGANRAYTDDRETEKRSLEAGLEAIRGYFLSVRLASFRALVNVNVSHGAFYEAKLGDEANPLMRLMDDCWTWYKLGKQQDGWRTLESFVKGLKVRTSYLKDSGGYHITQVRTIRGFSSPEDGEGQDPKPKVEMFAAPPSKVWFYLDEIDGKDVKKPGDKLKGMMGRAKNKYISVEDYFTSSISAYGFLPYLILTPLRVLYRVR